MAQPVPQNKQQEQTQQFLEMPLDAYLTADIIGNAPVRVKELPLKWLAIFRNQGTGFASPVADKLKVMEVSIVPTPNDPTKIEGRVSLEIELEPGMCTPQGVVHQGFLGFLIDECSTMAMVVANAGEGRNAPPGVSCSINILYHASALCGMTLRITNHSLATGWDSNSARTEVWDTKNHRLIATGTQLTMPPSVPGKWMEGKPADQ